MKILSILGSPKKNGNTNKILESFENKINHYGIEYERIDLIDYKIDHCIGCNKCNEDDFSCIFEDDMKILYKKIEESDIIILASPVYFNSVTSLMKVMIDRCQRFYNMKVNNNIKFKNKYGILISTAGSSDDESFIAFELIADYFYKSINGEIIDKIFIKNTDERDFSEEIEEKVKITIDKTIKRI